MSVEDLIKKASIAIRSSRGENVNSLGEDIDKRSEALIVNSILFADRPLKALVADVMGEDIETLFEDCAPSTGHIVISEEKSDKYEMKLGIVPSDYMLDLGKYKSNNEVKDRIIFLLNAVKVLYRPLKDYMNERAKKMNKPPFNYLLQIGHNTTLFLDKNSNTRIGILFKKTT